MRLVNEAIQWVAIIACLLLLVGCYRLVGLSRRSVHAATHEFDGVTGPPTGRKFSVPGIDLEPGVPNAVIYVSEGCPACAVLIESVASATGVLHPVLVAGGSDAFVTDLRDGLRLPVISDPDGRLAGASSVIATPYVVVVDAEGVVAGKGVTSDVTSFVEESLVATRGLQ